MIRQYWSVSGFLELFVFHWDKMGQIYKQFSVFSTLHPSFSTTYSQMSVRVIKNERRWKWSIKHDWWRVLAFSLYTVGMDVCLKVDLHTLYLELISTACGFQSLLALYSAIVVKLYKTLISLNKSSCYSYESIEDFLDGAEFS